MLSAIAAISAPTSATAARWSATASSARSTGGAGDPTAPTATSPTARPPNRALRLRVFPVREQYGCVFVWHQPEGKEPQWEMPDLFHKFPQFDTDPDAYYRPYPEFSRRAETNRYTRRSSPRTDRTALTSTTCTARR